MIKIYNTNKKYLNDIYSLIKEFYPLEEIHSLDLETLNHESIQTVLKENDKNLQSSIILFIAPEARVIKVEAFKGYKKIHSSYEKVDSDNKKTYRNTLKRMVYTCFSDSTGKDLSWGTLTGVRPTKIALEMMENKEKEEVIRRFMKEQYWCSDEKINISLRVAKKEHNLLQGFDYRKGYSIYIGIPFCPSTCLYCSFTSYSLDKFGDKIELYLQALMKEITYAATCFPNRKLTTIYLGGGTPTTLNENQLERLLHHIQKTLDFKDVREYTVEAGRPDSITIEKLKILKKYKVSRISINPQTMVQKTLDLIGRKHTVEQIQDSFYSARRAGHDNINMDIIIGLPGETKEDVRFTLSEIDKLQPDSLTVHTLALKRAARLNIEKNHYRDLRPKDTQKMGQLTWEYTQNAGYSPYYLYRQKNMADNLENIGYAKNGKEGLYNILIMGDKQTILALGAGALSKFVFYNESRIERVENVKSLKDYIERIDEMIKRKKDFLDAHLGDLFI